MINNTFDPAQALSNASYMVQSNLTTNLEECQRRVHLLHDWNAVGVFILAMTLVATSICCIAISSAIDLAPDIEKPRDPQLITEDSARDRKHRESRFIAVTGVCAVSVTSAYMLTLVLQFSRFCVASDTNDTIVFATAILAVVMAWGQLPLHVTAMVNLGHDVWVGKMVAKAERLPGWAIYALPVMAPGYLFLGAIKGFRALVDEDQRRTALRMKVKATDAGEADKILLPKYAEVDEAADGQEQAAAGAWC